ncbi:lysin [Streptococcus phage Javan268]|nr:bacterial SH3 domain protein [Streptococcus infantis SK970]QBX25693.1 lysin [Streptococcus phage Javan268]
MSTKAEVLQFAHNLANSGMGVDNDGAYGTQCADLPCYIMRQFFDVSLYGNAYDLLASAESQGVDVRYDVAYPEAGWIFVKSFVAGDGVNYGHTGLTVEDSDGLTVKTIEQNIDGNWDFLEVGGPARYHERTVGEIVGYIVPPYEDGTDDVSEVETEPTTDEIVLEEEDGTFTVGEAHINVRRAPNLTSDVVAVYEPGETVQYDSKGSANGYRWISFVGASGSRNYMAIGQTDEVGNRITLWGTVD